MGNAGNEWFEKLKSKNAIQKPIARSRQMIFKCDFNGKLFEGDTAEQDYISYMNALDWDNVQVPIESIKEPKTMTCLFEEYNEDDLDKMEADQKKEDSMSVNEVVESMLNETYESDDKHDDLRTVFVCPVCETRTRYYKLKDENAIPYNFKTLENFDTHLWEVHKQLVKREDGKVVVELTSDGTVTEA